MQILHIPRDFAAKPGTQLAEGLFVGKHIAHGLQVQALTAANFDSQPCTEVQVCGMTFKSALAPSGQNHVSCWQAQQHIQAVFFSQPKLDVALPTWFWLQGGVYDLVDQSGKTVNVVVKV